MSSYKRLQKLGAGAFATTFLVEEVSKSGATDKKKQQLVMKRVPCKHMRAANAALQEVKVLLSCHHEGIVGYHDFFLDTDSDENIVICLVMEFCDGGDLWEKIANARRSHTPLEPQMVAGWLLQLVSALRYLHARSILHRDIKPENVFLTDNGVVAKLGDFGLATATEDMEQGSAKTQVGTPDYMAPEVLEGRPYSAPADVFSLGATLYAMVCSSFPKMLALHLGQGKPLDWPPAADAMPLWKPLVERMLMVEEEKRPDLDEVGVIAAGLPESQHLEGVSLQAKIAATLPVSLNENSSSSQQPSASAASTTTVVPSRPSQPCATEVRHDQLVLLWEPHPPDDLVMGYQVLAQLGGAGGFRSLVDDTKSGSPVIHLHDLSERTWYEFKVVALNATGSSPASTASQPIQTLAAPQSAASIAAQQSAAATAAALAAELHMKSPRLNDSESKLIENEDPELLARYAQCKRELLAWEAKFDRQNGRPPTEQDKIADLTYQGLMARYKRLKHAKRRLVRGGSDVSDYGGGPLRSPGNPMAHAPQSSLASSNSGSDVGVNGSGAAGSSSLADRRQVAPLAPVSAPANAGWLRPPGHGSSGEMLLPANTATPVMELSPPPERPPAGGGSSSSSKDKSGGTTTAESPQNAPVSASDKKGHASKSGKKGTKSSKKTHLPKEGKEKVASGESGGKHPPKLSHAGSSSGVSSLGGEELQRSHTMQTMTVSMKASHPSPRQLAMTEEDFT